MENMGIVDIYSKREQRASGSKSDVLDHNNIPDKLRVQIVQIIEDVLGDTARSHEWYELIHRTLAREYGLHQLTPKPHQLQGDRLFEFIETWAEVPQVLDGIEVSFHVGREMQFKVPYRAAMYVQDAITELNQRFMEAGVGYQYESDRMIPINSRFAHKEIVKPALVLLSHPQYQGAQEEFLKAHQYFRDSDYKGCLTECVKAFESTMKAICEKRNWTFQKTDAAKTLIDICLNNGLIPSMLQSELNALQTVLQSGAPTLGNKLSRHGQGPVPTAVPQHVAAYALHLTAANILLLTSAEKSLP